MSAPRAASDRGGRWKWVPWVASAIVAATLVALFALEALRWPGVARLAQWAVQRHTGWSSTFEGCHARLLASPSIDCRRVRLGGQPWIDAREAHVAWRWRDLWHWRQGQALQLRAIRAVELDVRLLRDAQGRGNWRPPRAQDGDAADRARWPRTDELLVSRGRIEWRDAREGTQLGLVVEGADGGSWRAAIDGQWKRLPVTLQARSAALLPLLAARPGASTVPLAVEGRAGDSRIAFDGRAASLLGAGDLDGALQLSGRSLAAVGTVLRLTLPQTPPFELSGHLAHSGGVWQLTRTQAEVGRSRLGGDFTFDARTRPGMLTGRLTGERLILADLAPSIGAVGGDDDAPRERGRTLPQRPFNLPSLRAMRADLDVSIDQFDWGTRTLAPLRELRGHLVLRDGSLTLDPLAAALAGGQVRGSTRLDAPGGDAAQWTAQLAFDGVELASALRAGRVPGARPGNGADPLPYITGRLRGELDVRGRGQSTAAILSSLDGRADLAVRDGTLSHLVTELIGLDVAQAIGVAVRGDRALPLRCARIRLQVDDGVAELRQAVLDNRDSTVRMAGQVSLAKETLSVVMRARPKDVSPLSLRAPVHVTGPWRDPKVGIEGGRVAGRVLGAAALGAALGPLAALLPLIDPGEKPQGDPCAADRQSPASRAGAAPMPR